MYKVELKVMPRKGILNPESATVTRALDAMSYDKIEELEMGRYMEFEVNLTTEKEVEAYVEEVCQKLLVNPVIEDYTYQITPVKEG